MRARESDALAEAVIGAAIEVHRHLGPGLMESAYQRCLTMELTSRGIGFAAHVSVPVSYKGETLECGYRLDLLVDGRLVVELKAAEQILPVHQAQLLTYMKLLKIRRGLLINFNVPRLVEGIRAFIL